jgi:putative CocE/NonD family hydrolase
MMNYSGFQNAFAHRSVSAPMKRWQKPTGRYQLLQGPWYHLTAGTGWDIYRTELAWFDRWLKNEQTGIETVKQPLHLYSLGANSWFDTTHYPLTQAKPKTFWLDGGSSGSGAPSLNDGRLTSDKPKASSGQDQMVYTPATSPCARPVGQWSMGALQLVLEEAKAPENPCDQDDRSIQTGPGAVTYTTDPVKKTTTIAGPIDATIYASSTRPDVALVAFVEDVGPDGKSFPLTSGALLGSFRALDNKRSWFAPDGKPLAPYHPYTRASVQAVPEGQTTRYDIEVFPIVAELKPGHRLRLTLNTADSPHLLPLPHQATNLAGGVYQVQRNAGNASFLEVPVASPQDFHRAKLGREQR